MLFIKKYTKGHSLINRRASQTVSIKVLFQTFRQLTFS